MSPVSAGLDGLLALLLLLALGLGLKLNARLKTLREGQAGFAAAVIELNQAAARAEAGLVALKAASDTAHDDLLARIETARGLVGRLERAGEQASRHLEALPDRQAPAPRPAGAGGSLAAIAALAEGRLIERGGSQSEGRAESGLETRTAPPPAPRRPVRAAIDEDLFETKTRDRGELGPLRPSRGER